MIRFPSRALAACGLMLLPLCAGATSQGPHAEGTYVGTLPCADCSGMRTELTLYTMGQGGQPESYRMRVTYVGTRDGDRTEERLGPWVRIGDIVRLEPYDASSRRSFRRVDADTLVALDRDERPIATTANLTLGRDAKAAPLPRVSVIRVLFRGTLTREGDKLLLTPCGSTKTDRVRDVSVESTISAVLADLGFDRSGRMYIEAFGRRADGQLMFERLNRTGVEMRCPEAPSRATLRARGNEPGWAVDAGSSGVTMTTMDGTALKAPPVPVSWTWPGGRPDQATAVVPVSTEGGAWRTVLTPRICRDTMADAAFGFTAVVERQRPAPATTFKGCGFLDAGSLP